MTALSKFFTSSVIMALLGQDCTRTDTVRDGDTCDRICFRNAVPYHQLRVYNPWINDGCTNLHAGDYLCLAKERADCDTVNTHLVLKGETCRDISQIYDINMQTFMVNNGLTIETCMTDLRAGEIVCVSPYYIPYPRGLDELD